MARAYFCASVIGLILAGCAMRPAGEASDGRAVDVDRQASGTENLIIGVHALNDRVVWASGTGGTFLRTVDGGAEWHVGEVPGADSLQFRDVHAVSPDEAYLLSIGSGDASRIYRTVDRGDTWEMQFISDRSEAFFDCFAFWDDGAGIAFSDAVDGRFPILRRTGADEMWRYVEDAPSAQPNEGGFAASGTCVVTLGENVALIGTGNADQARVLRSADRGRSWSAADVPVHSREAAGIATLAFRDSLRGAALGGDIANPDTLTRNVAVTSDGGRTWAPATPTPLRSAVYGAAYAPDASLLVAVGPGGAVYSTDHAASWTTLDSLAHWGIDFGSRSTAWMVGPEGRISKITF